MMFALGVLCAAALLAGCTRSPQAKEARFLKRGEAFFLKKDYARAALEFKNATAVMPKDAEPYYQAGLVYLELGNVANAVNSFRTATALNPNHAGAQVKLASLMATSQNKTVIEEAEKRLKGVLAAAPTSLEVLNNLAVAESKLGKMDDAVKLFDEAAAKFPSDLRASALLARLKIKQNDLPGAEEVLKKAVARAPNSADAALMLGRVYLQQRKLAEAETQIRRALELDPKNAPALMSLGLILMNTNRPADAEQTYKKLGMLPNKDYQPVYGLFLFQQNKRDAAIAEFQRLVAADPGDRSARTLLLAGYMTMNRFSEADTLLASVLKRNPKDTEALLQRSELRLRTQDATGAEKDLQEVLKLRPDSAEAHFRLAKAKELQGLPRSARQELNQSLMADRNHLLARLDLAWSLVNANEAKTALDLMDQTPPAQKDDLRVLMARNWALLGLGRLKEARQGIDQGLSQARAPDLLEQDGFLKLNQGDFLGARADAEELLKLYPEEDPHNLKAVRLLVNACIALNQKPRAIETMRNLVSQRPHSAQLQTLLGRVYMAFGNVAEGQKAFEAAQAADPGFVPARLELAAIDLNEKRFDSARRTLTAVVASNPRNVTALLMLADTEASAGALPAAIAKYRSVLDLDGSNIQALNNLSSVMITDNPDEALRFAQQAVEIAPEDAATQDTLGWAYYRKGIYQTATEHLKVAVAKEPTPRRQYRLAMAYLKSGDRALGQPLLASALKQDPALPNKEKTW
jgi:tetratricopeptide (TPR) repeat protein